MPYQHPPWQVCLHCFSPLNIKRDPYHCTDPKCGLVWSVDVYKKECQQQYGQSDGVPHEVFKKFYEDKDVHRSVIPKGKVWRGIRKNPSWCWLVDANERIKKKREAQEQEKIPDVPDGCSCSSPLCT